jgi:hypothetical protein
MLSIEVGVTEADAINDNLVLTKSIEER